MTATAVPPASTSEAAQLRALTVTRRQAGALLAAVTAVFVTATVVGAEGWLAYVQAAAEASMVGGLADWFAVTALFRRPLGLPIPHTAVIPERKDRFGETLGRFVADSFLTPESIVDRVRDAQVASRAAAWLADEANAHRAAGYALDGAVVVADLLKDDDVQDAIEQAITARLERIDLAPAAGRLLAALTEEGRHDELVTSLLVGAAGYLETHQDQLHERFADASPWWLPGAVEDRIFGRIIDGAGNVLDAMASDPDHELRRQLDERIADLAQALQEDPDLIARGEQLKRDLLEEPALRQFLASAWGDLKANLRTQAEHGDSPLRARLTEAAAATGARFANDPFLTKVVQDALERGVTSVVERFDDEVAGIVTQTISRWDGEETSRRLELLLGPDLQFIRINGTVVGGLAGVVLHAVADVLG